GVPAGQFRSVPAVPRRCRAAAGGDRVPRAGSCAATCPPARLDLRAGARRAPGDARSQRARLRPDRTETPVMTLTALLEKYDVPVPRYTSYPTVPQWHDTPSTDEWIASIGRAAGRTDAGLAVYVHLPFCESLCTYCGCNTVITRAHGRAAPYVDRVLAELQIDLDRVPALAEQPFRQLHLGGGTPTFLSAAELARLVKGLYARLPHRDDDFEGSVEVDP